jgi:undecaprenyl-diphosphatase
MSAIWAWVRRHPRVAAGLIVLGVALQGFIALADELREGELATPDLRIQQAILAVHSPALTDFAHGLSDILVLPYVIGLLLPFVLVLIAMRQTLAAVVIVVVPSLTGLLVTGLKVLFHRPRPTLPLDVTFGQSFPSGHATGSTVLYGLICYVICKYWLRWRWGRALAITLTALLIIATGWSRVYLRAHYPSDVLAGWAAGACILTGTIFALELHENRKKLHKEE